VEGRAIVGIVLKVPPIVPKVLMIMILVLTTLAMEVHHLEMLHGVWMESIT